jgi:hypothetical protein
VEKHINGKKKEPFKLPVRPGAIEGFYFASGFVASLGFLVGGLQGTLLALLCHAMLWILLALRKKSR